MSCLEKNKNFKRPRDATSVRFTLIENPSVDSDGFFVDLGSLNCYIKKN